MKKVIVLLDHTKDYALSYLQVVESIKNRKPIIYTNCLEFFDFSTLERGYDVTVIKKHGEYITLSELLVDDENNYTKRKIKKSHNVKKLLLSGELEFKR